MAATIRPKNAAAKRVEILAAARRRFAADSYEVVGLRDVARDAAVDVALVSRYFGSKEELFRKVLLERSGEEWFGGRTDPRELAEWLAALAMGENAAEDREDLERLYIILRSASSPAIARIIGDAFLADVFYPLARLLGDADAQVRAGLALSLVIGATVINGIISVDAIGEDLRQDGRRKLADMIATALS